MFDSFIKQAIDLELISHQTRADSRTTSSIVSATSNRWNWYNRWFPLQWLLKAHKNFAEGKRKMLGTFSVEWSRKAVIWSSAYVGAQKNYCKIYYKKAHVLQAKSKSPSKPIQKQKFAVTARKLIQRMLYCTFTSLSLPTIKQKTKR